MKDKFKSTITHNLKPYKLPNGWQWFFWEDIMKSYQQGLIRSNSQLGEGNVEYLKMGDLDSSGNVNLDNLKLTQATEKEILDYSLKEGDFLINVRNSLSLVGKTCVIDGVKKRKILFNHMLVRIENGSPDLNYFINAFLNIPSSQKLLNRIKEGTTTIIALYQRELNKLPIALPENKTFHGIVNIYKSLRKKIELNNKINAELEAMAKTIYEYWFVQFDFPDENGKPYKSSGGKMIYNEQLKREIPEGWEAKKLSEIANIVMGQSPSGSSYNSKGDGMVFFQGSTDFGWRFPSIRQYTTSPNRLAKEGDILISVRAPVGTLNIAADNCCIGRGLAALRSKNGYNVHLYYVMEFFKKVFDHHNNTGTTFGSITKTDLHSLKLPFPPEALLKQYENIAAVHNRRIFLNHRENVNLKELRDWLLPMLMNGQVSVGEAEEELRMVAEENVNYGER